MAHPLSVYEEKAAAAGGSGGDGTRHESNSEVCKARGATRRWLPPGSCSAKHAIAALWSAQDSSRVAGPPHARITHVGAAPRARGLRARGPRGGVEPQDTQTIIIIMRSPARAIPRVPGASPQVSRSCREAIKSFADPTIMHKLQLQLAIAEDRFEDAVK